MSGIFNPSIFNNAIFNTGSAVVVVQPTIKTGTGGIDPKKKRRTIYKPTGLIDRKPEGQKGVEQRVLESRDIHQEVLGQIIDRSQVDFRPIQSLTSAEVDREIAYLMKEKLDKIDEEETMMVLMMALDD